MDCGGNRALSAKENGIINKGVEEGANQSIPQVNLSHKRAAIDNILGGLDKTITVNYETTESTNKREFEAYGPIKQRHKLEIHFKVFLGPKSFPFFFQKPKHQAKI
uniref:Uncharacterized protein n=1 Tax=Lactuca sativa TaxID=4236 RepID=A0A9R1XJW3_LACSA|nr:hypothetical protein LSAT_V11C300154820 [Lactuca sativa]